MYLHRVGEGLGFGLGEPAEERGSERLSWILSHVHRLPRDEGILDQTNRSRRLVFYLSSKYQVVYRTALLDPSIDREQCTRLVFYSLS